MRNIVTIKFGSHLYGTTTPASDLDFKSVYVPSAHDILLQRVKGSINKSRQKAAKEKNLPGEIEEESYSLQRYLELLSEGQTVALDILFAPEWSMTEAPAPEWRELVDNRSRLLTRRSAAFIGYCRQQANKYGIKGFRVAAARAALVLLKGLVEEHGSTSKLAQFEAAVSQQIAGIEHMVIVDIPLANGTLIRHWDVCGRMLPFTASIKNARDIVQRLVDEYGQRALQAENQQGVDWKALSHAVRVGTQAIEFLGTGHVTFPLPNAEHVLAIKQGKVVYQDVSREIDSLLESVEAAALVSSLPETPDLQWIDDFVQRVYRAEICRS
jgi:RNA repair pathway DNA polymerase beta family